jgi:RNA polymerase sigma-70 factor, ECF subfamily
VTTAELGVPFPGSRVPTREAPHSGDQVALGCTEDFVAFYETTVVEVYRYVFTRCGRCAQVAEDLTQEVYLAAVAAVRRGALPDLHVSWLIGVARHKLVDFYRRDERHRRNLRAVADLHRPHDEMATWRSADAHGPLLAALESLPALQRAALILRHVDGLGVPEVAEGIGRTVRATESILSRGRQALRARYQEALHD